MKKNVLLFTMALIFSFSLCACNSGEQEPTGESSADEVLSSHSSDNQDLQQSDITSGFDPEIWEILPEIPITDQGEFEYELEEEGVVITNYLGSSTEVRIPDAIITKDYGVRSVTKVDLGDCEKELTELIMPNNIDSYIISYEIKSSLKYQNFPVAGVGSSAFYNCPNLVAVYIPEGVDKIGYSAFARCDGLTSIIVPESVTNIGATAFALCKNLTSVEIRGDAVIEIGAFSDCSALNVTLSDSTTGISKDAFVGCGEEITVTYKGNTYDYDHLDDLYDAINDID